MYITSIIKCKCVCAFHAVLVIAPSAEGHMWPADGGC